MDFLVQVDNSRVYTLPQAERDDIITRERERGRELITDGVIRHFWSRAGQHGNVGIWSAPDGDALHAALTSLPIWPYASFTVTPLAAHVLMPRAAQSRRRK